MGGNVIARTAQVDTVDHSVVVCPAWAEHRYAFRDVIGDGDLTRPALVQTMLSKIVLPHKLRYLENMLNAEVVAKAAKIRQRMEANPNIPDMDKGWPMLLGQYQADDKSNVNSIPKNIYPNLYNRRMPNF
uniref:SFRICE_021875 n=1 Tax=Spodoptera frugiperda TaxID=7108 RepID=A0A2H1WV20_SPOFR